MYLIKNFSCSTIAKETKEFNYTKNQAAFYFFLKKFQMNLLIFIVEML